ncbi:MAG: TrkH family potassium uptake protein [Firmicutes bacterium]|nr:TrkH family potassium uptake protein [Bacillota bacterium]
MNSRKANNSALVKILGTIILIIGTSMLIPWIYSEVTGDAAAAHAFRICTPATLLAGLVITVLFRSDHSRFHSRDGFLIVTLCWILASVIGMFPYQLSGETASWTDAFFESTSGMTTTGATAIYGGISSSSLLLWKALSHWLGGMGILVFVISVLPALGISGQSIVRAETPGPVYQKTTTRATNSARMLYVTYFTFSVAEFILLLLSGKMSCFEAAVTTLGCISTGGLAPVSGGISSFGSLYVEMVVAVFCILASINFILYHYTVTGRISQALRDVELRAYLVIIAGASLLCTFSLMQTGAYDVRHAFVEAFFQTASMASTAGYVKTAGLVWPVSCQFILLTLMIIGGCSASTAGSIKVVRILVMLRLISRNCIRRIHPRSVVAVKLGGNAVSAPVVSNITAFLLTFAGIIGLSGLILSLQGFDMETNLTTAIAMLSNTGTAVTHAVATGDFSMYHPGLKLYLCALMITGRLELFTVIILFTRNFWGKNR